ncbi:MAG: hypothetical protein JNK72_26050 [Myxococcales bacterium]|nr:hypothetical protein [Myxococcales bacterium]
MASGDRSRARALRSTALETLVAIGFLSLGLARLRRVARPVFVPVETLAPGVARGEVRLGARRLGESVMCRGREVLPQAGRAPLRIHARDPAGRWVEVVRNGQIERLIAQSCEIVTRGPEGH